MLGLARQSTWYSLQDRTIPVSKHSHSGTQLMSYLTTYHSKHPPTCRNGSYMASANSDIFSTLLSNTYGPLSAQWSSECGHDTIGCLY